VTVVLRLCGGAVGVNLQAMEKDLPNEWFIPHAVLWKVVGSSREVNKSYAHDARSILTLDESFGDESPEDHSTAR
jgi:hypothetical protein